jgi:DNA-binding NtrC family response regulator
MGVDCASASDDIVRGGRVLVVDDEGVLRRVLRRGLVQAGFDVVEADTGLAALELARRERFDLIVSDVNMPVMDGVELLSALLTAQPDVPVVLISGSVDVQGTKEARCLGAFDFLRKPFDLSELEQIARRAVDNRRAQTASKAKGPQHA